MRETRKGIIKTKELLDQIASSSSKDGWHLKGQFFPIENSNLIGREFEFTKQWLFCWTTIIDGEYRFISEEAIVFL